MFLFKKNIHNGISIPKNKDKTKDLPTEDATVPETLYFPMAMHIGKPAEVSVTKGDKVKIGTVVGSGEEGLSANIHSSISGVVKEIKEMESLRGKSQTVIIENDFKDEMLKLPILDNKIDTKTFSQRLRDAGITGKGGAGFPTSIKYDEDKNKINYLVVNGSECEPYSTTDHRCMVEYSEEIIKIIKLICEIYSIDYAYIAVEHPMKEAIKNLESAIKKENADNIILHELGDEYPQGHSGLQIREVLGIEIEENQRSGDVGVLQSNVSTIKAIYDAVFLGLPFTKRIITVTGSKIKEPKNLLTRIGTPIQSLIEDCKGLKGEEITMINGGPMMGKEFKDINLPVDKDTTTLLFLEKIEIKPEEECIRCAKCINHCPVALQPIIISNNFIDGRYEKAPLLRSESCIFCGICTYVCPASIPLLKNIQKLNKKWEELSNE